MFSIEVQSLLNATHALRLPNGETEPAHAHVFQITARLASRKLDAMETVIDFHVIEKLLAEIVRPWQYKNLNDLETFKSPNGKNPSAERIAEHIGGQLQSALAASPDPAAKNLQLIEIRLTEAPNCLAIWSPD